MTIDEIGINLAKSLANTFINLLGKSVILDFGKTSSVEVKEFVKQFYPQANFTFLDGTYRTINWDKWCLIDRTIWDITKKQWESEVWDCDDKAYTHKYWILRIFGVPQFIVHGHCYDLNGNWKYGHFWNAKIADGKLYFYEPDGNIWAEVIKGKKVIMKNKEYRPLTFEF